MKPVQTPPLVGRSEELGQLEDALALVQGGAGHCILLSGEAGVGKSRLIAEARAMAIGQGFTVLIGRCFDQDRSYPYTPLIEMLRPWLSQTAGRKLLEDLGPQAHEVVKLLPELADRLSAPQPAPPPDAATERRRLFEALTNLLLGQAAAGPLLIIVEDLHWADEASLAFLLHLVRHAADRPLLLLLSSRREEARSELNTLWAGLDREPSAQEIGLNPLTEPEVAEQLRAILNQPQELSAEFVAAIYRLSEGNPFYAEEICASLIASGDIYKSESEWRRKPLAQLDIPDSLQRLVKGWLGQIDRPARQLLDLAAVSGRSFDYPVLQFLTGHDDSQFLALVKELMTARLVVEESADVFAFRHALMREALYGRLLARERQALHGQLVRAIEGVHAGALEQHLGSLAYHAFEAGLWAKALDYGRRAGERALALYAPRAAAEQLTRAIQAAGQLGSAPDAGLYRARGRAFDILGEFEQAREDYETGLAAAESAGDEEAAWQTTLDLGLLWASRDYAQTGEYCRKALALARRMEEPAPVGHSLNRLGNWHMNSGRPKEALVHHHEALALFESLDDQAGIAATLDLLAMASNQAGDELGTVRYYRRAIPILRQLNDRQTLASSLTMLSLYTLNEEMVREAIALAREIDWRSGEAYAWEYLGQLLATVGDYGGGLAAARQGLEMAQAIDHRLWQVWGDLVLGFILLEVLAVEAAYQHLRRAETLATEVGVPFMIAFARGYLALACLLLDKPDEAARLLPEALEGSISMSDFGLAIGMAEYALAREDTARARKVLDQFALPERADGLGGMVYFYGQFSLLQGEILKRLGRPLEAKAALLAALESCQAQGVRMGIWRLHLALGKLQREVGENQQAELAFEAARTVIDELAATIPDDGLREAFRSRAMTRVPPAEELTPRQAKKAAFGGLTKREREVATVVAQGLTNQEIADELVVSIKTVEAHVTRILSKLGFSSRSQIAGWAVDKGLAAAPQDLDSLAANS